MADMRVVSLVILVLFVSSLMWLAIIFGNAGNEDINELHGFVRPAAGYAICGNNNCEPGEDPIFCPRDCDAKSHLLPE